MQQLSNIGSVSSTTPRKAVERSARRSRLILKLLFRGGGVWCRKLSAPNEPPLVHIRFCCRTFKCISSSSSSSCGGRAEANIKGTFWVSISWWWWWHFAQTKKVCVSAHTASKTARTKEDKESRVIWRKGQHQKWGWEMGWDAVFRAQSEKKRSEKKVLKKDFLLGFMKTKRV